MTVNNKKIEYRPLGREFKCLNPDTQGEQNEPFVWSCFDSDNVCSAVMGLFQEFEHSVEVEQRFKHWFPVFFMDERLPCIHCAGFDCDNWECENSSGKGKECKE